MSERAARTTRAVECNYPSCKNRTRDASLYCNHHRRASTNAMPDTLYRDGATTVDRLRAPSLAAAVQQGRAVGAAAVEASDRAMDRFPELVEDGDGLRLVGAFRDTDTIGWPGGDVRPDEVGTVDLKGSRLRRDGDDLVLTPPDGMTYQQAALHSPALRAQRDAWARVMSTEGLLAGLGEEYDDAAEVLGLLYLNDDDALRVVYSSTDERDVNVTVEDGSRGGLKEHYRVVPQVGSVDGRITSRNFADPVDRVTWQHEGATASAAVPDEIRSQRSQLLDRCCEAMDLVTRFRVDVNGRLYLPAGWTDRDV